MCSSLKSTFFEKRVGKVLMKSKTNVTLEPTSDGLEVGRPKQAESYNIVLDFQATSTFLKLFLYYFINQVSFMNQVTKTGKSADF